MAAGRRVTHQATITRALTGLAVAGAVPGVLLTVAVFLAMRSGGAGVKLPVVAQWWWWPALVLTYSLGFILLGALAAPVWWQLDRRGWRQWWVAAVVGAAPLALATGVLTVVDLFRLQNPPGAMASMLRTEALGVLVVTALGAVMGLIAWRVAYRRVPDAAEAF